MWENKSPWKANSSLKNVRKSLSYQDIKTNCTCRVINIVWYLLKNKENNEGKKTQDTETQPTVKVALQKSNG